MQNEIKNGFIKRAQEAGYTEGQAVDMFNKVANFDVSQFIQDPRVLAGLAGAGVGGLAGASSKEHKGRNAMLGALGGGALGAGAVQGAGMLGEHNQTSALREQLHKLLSLESKHNNALQADPSFYQDKIDSDVNQEHIIRHALTNAHRAGISEKLKWLFGATPAAHGAKLQ